MPKAVTPRQRARAARVCANCINYPCFAGIETMSCNLAITCHKYSNK